MVVHQAKYLLIENSRHFLREILHSDGNQYLKGP